MQDLHAVVGGRIFDGGAMDRRLRPLSHHHALKCPRCDSLNTKFCYYNNYNLSQPRHFCKGCRRYWTKGGVLRNVPVGGGCRKTNKRSKVKPSPAKTANDTAVTSQKVDRKLTSQYSSSESSGYTAAAAEASAGIVNTTLEYVGKSNSGGACFSHGAFADIGGLIAAAVSEPIPGGFNFSNRAALLSQQSQDTWQQQDQFPGTFLDRTVEVDLGALQSGFVPFDWQPCKDQGGVDLASGTVVDQPYWSQIQINWTDNNDHPALYLP